MLEANSLDRRSDAPEVLFRRHMENLVQGFEVREVVVEIEPQSRTVYAAGVDGEFGRKIEMIPFASPEDAKYYEYFQRLVGKLIKLHGEENVNVMPLPPGVHATTDYPEDMHRLVMVRPSPSGWQIENALSGGSHSPFDVIKDSDRGNYE